MNWALVSNVEENSWNENVNAREVSNEMNQTWRKKLDWRGISTIEFVITESDGLGDSLSSK